MATIHEITEDWQREGLSPTWVKLQQAQAEFDAMAADSARYWGLISFCEYDGFGYWLPEVCLKKGNLPPSKAESDAAIDAAMKGE